MNYNLINFCENDKYAVIGVNGIELPYLRV